MPSYEPLYLETHKKGLLKKKIKKAREIMKACVVCPRKPNVRPMPS